MRTHRIAVLPGDGIGPNVIESAVKVLRAVERKTRNYRLKMETGEAGFACIAKYGTNVPPQTVEMLKKTETCLKGPMTTPEEAGAPPSAAMQIRKMMNLYANVRPCLALPNSNPLRQNIDLIVVRENTEGLYSNLEFKVGEDAAVAMRVISRKASERIANFAFKLAMKRKKHLTYVHKANILRETDGVFNQAVLKMARKYPTVEVDDLHVDNMAMQLIKKPETFDVIVTTNLFGDILSDEAAEITGGVGLAPGANLGSNYAMFEPVHGSAPGIADKRIANPIATILSGKMMLDYLGEKRSATMIFEAVKNVLAQGDTLPHDLGGKATTAEMTDAIVQKIQQ